MMNSSSKVTKRMFALPLICRICGGAARGINFDVMTCMSCKAFFRRNALRPAGHLRCKHEYNCEITTASRTEYAACRLKKCFTLGMKPQMIRVVSQYQSIRNNKQQLCMTERSQFQLPTLRPLGLVQNDRSTLTSEQWNLLSNVINVYDGQNIVKDIQCLLAEESSLPVRLRAKPSTALNYINKCISSVQTLLKRSPHFHSLSFNSRRSVIHNNIYLTSYLNAAFISSEVDLWSNTDFDMSCNTLLGDDYFTQFAAVPPRLDSNGILKKIMLFIIAFSSNYSIVIVNNQPNMGDRSSSIDTIHIQNIFVTLLWKYLLYQFGYIEAIRRYSSLVKGVLDVLHELEELANSAIYQQMFNMLVIQTEHLLIIDD